MQTEDQKSVHTTTAVFFFCFEMKDFFSLYKKNFKPNNWDYKTSSDWRGDHKIFEPVQYFHWRCAK